jgi:hypothetical protein
MTESQLLTAIKAELVAQLWTGGANVVFPTGCVAITANVDLAMEAALKTMRTPFALLQPMGTTPDPEFDEDPNFVALNLQVRIVVMVPGDSVGENALMGGNKTGGATVSEGKGIFDVEQEVFNAIGKLNGLESIILQCRQKGGISAAIVGDNVYVAYRDLQFEALGTLV